MVKVVELTLDNGTGIDVTNLTTDTIAQLVKEIPVSKDLRATIAKYKGKN